MPTAVAPRLLTPTRIAIAICAVGVVLGMGLPGSSQPQPKGAAESGLIGVKLFANGTDLIKRFGSPNSIQPIVVTGFRGGAGGDPSGGGAPGPSGGGPGSRGMGGGSDLGMRPADWIGDPFDLGTTNEFRQDKLSPGPSMGGGGQDLPTLGPSGGGGDFGGGAAPGGGIGGGGTDGGTVTNFTRWVYRTQTSRYSFVLDRFNRVVQIEAVALADSRVKTRRGVTFGTTFGKVIQLHGAPDAYVISGDNIVLRYLARDKVAYRLAKVGPNKPHQVTGIVVSAGAP